MYNSKDLLWDFSFSQLEKLFYLFVLIFTFFTPHTCFLYEWSSRLSCILCRRSNKRCVKHHCFMRARKRPEEESPISKESLSCASPLSVCAPRVSELCGSRRRHPWSPWNRQSSACGRHLSASFAPSRCLRPPAVLAAPYAARWGGRPPAWRHATPFPGCHTAALRNKHINHRG